MRILLAHNSPYYPSHGGGDRSNRLLMEALAARGHACRVVARTASFGEAAQVQLLTDLAARSTAVDAVESGVVRFRLAGVEVHAAANHPHLRGYFAAQIEEFNPDVVLASTDDPAQVLLEAAVRSARARVVYVARATLALPFGPDCAFPSEAKAAVLRQVDGVVGVSRYVADYIRRWGQMEAVHVPISLLDPGPWPLLGRFDNEFVTLVNPCAVKGITILLALARQFPDVRFAAVPTWGTNREDLEALRMHSNITVLEPADQIDAVLSRTRVLLVPSLWVEARSRIIVEAMLRGVPVMASNVGGIPEAMMGQPYLLPARTIKHYRPQLDEQMVPVAEVPEQDAGPWAEALTRLVGSQAHWEEVSRASRAAALDYAEALSIEPFERRLEQVLRAPRRSPAEKREAPEEAAEQSLLSRLSPEKRALLALRLRQKVGAAAATGEWFPKAEVVAGAKLRLFCFAHAGGGTSAFRGWGEVLPAAVQVCPARLPGRESRGKEPPLRRMEALIEALGAAIRPYADSPFAFFGHSMGAAVAFELARWLRRSGLPLPQALLVSAARAPQFRLGHVPPPEPDEQQFIDELRRLEGLPKEVLEHEELLRLILPALRADAELYRNYVYEPEPPLPCPIRAFGGRDDPNVRREHLEAWREQTSSSFALHVFPGGHFFIETSRDEFLTALASELANLET